MSKPKKKPSHNARVQDADERTLLGKMTRLLEILVRLNLQNMRGDRSYNDMISMLDSIGCGQSEIAGLLGTSTNTVKVSLYRAKRKAGKK